MKYHVVILKLLTHPQKLMWLSSSLRLRTSKIESTLKSSLLLKLRHWSSRLSRPPVVLKGSSVKPYGKWGALISSTSASWILSNYNFNSLPQLAAKFMSSYFLSSF